MIIENNIPERFFTTVFDMLKSQQSRYNEINIQEMIEMINSNDTQIAISKNGNNTYHLFGKIGKYQVDYSSTLDNCVKKIFFMTIMCDDSIQYLRSDESKIFLEFVKPTVQTLTNSNIAFYDDQKMVSIIENVTKDFLERTTFFSNYDGGHGHIELETTKDDQYIQYHMRIKRFNRHSICKKIITFNFSSKYVDNIKNELALFQANETYDLTFIPSFLREVGNCIIDFYNELLHYDDSVKDDVMIERSLMEWVLLPGYKCSFFNDYTKNLVKNALKNIDSN